MGDEVLLDTEHTPLPSRPLLPPRWMGPLKVLVRLYARAEQATVTMTAIRDRRLVTAACRADPDCDASAATSHSCGPVIMSWRRPPQSDSKADCHHKNQKSRAWFNESGSESLRPCPPAPARRPPGGGCGRSRY